MDDFETTLTPRIGRSLWIGLGVVVAIVTAVVLLIAWRDRRLAAQPPSSPPAPTATPQPTTTLPPDVLTLEQARIYTAKTPEQTWFFDGAAGQRLVLDVTPLDETLDPLVRIEGPGGDLLAYDEDNGKDGGASVMLALGESGRYTAQVGVEGQGPYQISLREAAPGELLPGAHPDFLRVVGTERAVAWQGTLVSIDQPGSAIDFRYEGEQGEALTVFANSPSADPLVAAFGPAGELLASDDDGGLERNARLTLTLPRDGTYTFRVGVVGPATGEVLFSVDRLQRGDLRTSDDIAFDSPEIGSLQPNRDDDYVFLATEGQQFAVRLDVLTPGSDFTVQLLRPDGRVVEPNPSFTTEEGGVYRYAVPSDGDTTAEETFNYGLRVFSTTGGRYRLTLTERSGFIEAVRPITLGETITAPAPGGLHMDVWTFTVEDVPLEVAVQLVAPPATWARAFLRAPDGSVALQLEERFVSKQREVATLTVPGTYQVEVRTDAPPDAQVSLLVEEPPPGEIVQEIAQPSSLTLGESGTATLSGVHAWTIEGPPGSLVTVSVEAEAGMDLDLEVFHNTAPGISSNSTGEVEQLTFRIETDPTVLHVIPFNGQPGAYTISVVEGDGLATEFSTPAELGDVLTGTIPDNQTAHEYTFTIPPGQRVLRLGFDLAEGNDLPLWHLLREDWQVINQITRRQTGLEGQAFTYSVLPYAGTEMRLRLASTGGELSYQIALSAESPRPIEQGSLRTSEPVTAEMTTLDEVHSWTFTAEEGQALDLRRWPLDDVNLTTTITDPQGRRVPLGGVATLDGTYVAQVALSEVVFSDADSIPYTLGLYDGTLTTDVTTLPLNQLTEGLLPGYDHHDHWLISGEAGQRIVLRWRELYGGPIELELLGPDGEPVDLDTVANVDDDGWLSLTLPESGVYTLIVTPTGPEVTVYRLIAEGRTP